MCNRADININKVILPLCLIALIFSVLPIIVSYKSSVSPKIPPNPFTTTWSFGEDGRTLSISGDSAGHAACKQTEFRLTLDNRSCDNLWQGSYRILLINREEVVEEIANEEFTVAAGDEIQKPLIVTFPVDIVKGPVGLCVIIPPYASMVTTLWVGKISAGDVGPWPDITSCPYLLTEEESRDLAYNFVRNSPTFVFDGIEESLLSTETLDLLKEHKPGNQKTYTQIQGWMFTFSFESRHTGYGDRSGEPLTQVITPHEAVIIVEAGKITSAIMDGQWDMLNQKTLNIQQHIEISNTATFRTPAMLYEHRF